MKELLAYLADPDSMDELAQARLRRILKRYPWFSTARLLLSKASRHSDPLVQLRYLGRPLPEVLLEKPTEAHFTGGRTLDVISRFLARTEEPAPQSVSVEPGDLAAGSVEEDPDLVSEELARIYLDQGLESKARDIYAKLSLLYPEKSVYFAEIIDRIGRGPADAEM